MGPNRFAIWSIELQVRRTRSTGIEVLSKFETKRPESLDPVMVAPCGLNCDLCRLTFRVKSQCFGCRSEGAMPKYCTTCRIRNCDEITLHGKRFCFECPEYPCRRLRQMDARYRSRYGMSTIENLEFIRQHGLDRFVDSEKQKWECSRCGALICVHKQTCIFCGQPRVEMAQK